MGIGRLIVIWPPFVHGCGVLRESYWHISLFPHSSSSGPSRQIILRCSNCSWYWFQIVFITPFPGPGKEQQPQFCKPLTAAGWSIISISQARISTIYVSKKKIYPEKWKHVLILIIFYAYIIKLISSVLCWAFSVLFFFFLRNTRRSVVPWAESRNSDYILSFWDSEFGTLRQTKGLFDLRFSASWGPSHHLGLKKKFQVLPSWSQLRWQHIYKNPRFNIQGAASLIQWL